MPSASPIASGSTPQSSASARIRVLTITAARDCADRDAQEKCAPQPDRVGQRTGEQREHRHRRRPDPADECPGRLIAETQILRQPQDHRLVRDRVGRVDQELDQEREPQFPVRSFQHRELGKKAHQARFPG